jgi:uracil-DNA glycosylase
MHVQIEDSWKKVLEDEFKLPYFIELSRTVGKVYLEGAPIYPAPKAIFKAFELCPFDSVKVVILGQDPYHGVGQAHGLCFSVQEGVKVPPSLKNIYKELLNDLNIPISNSGNLEHWAKQGVLLLNATLTVEGGKPGSHQGLGWEQFTDAIIQKISNEKEHVVFLLWGKYAEMKGGKIDTKKHLVLTAPHPSPFSAYTGFFGCKHFSITNKYLRNHGEKPIEW